MESGRRRWEGGEDEMEFGIALPEDMEALVAAMKNRIQTRFGTTAGSMKGGGRIRGVMKILIFEIKTMG